MTASTPLRQAPFGSLGACCLALALVLAAPLARAQDEQTPPSETVEGAAEAPPAEAPAPGEEPPAPATQLAPAPEEAAPTDEPPPSPAPADDAPEGQPPPPELATDDEPTLGERRLIAYIATGVSAASLITGAVLGFLAQDRYACLSDIQACNTGLDDPIEGTEYLDAVAEVQRTAVLADMAYVLAATAAVVAVTGYLRGFVFTGEEADEEANAGLSLPVPAPVLATGTADTDAEVAR